MAEPIRFPDQGDPWAWARGTIFDPNRQPHCVECGEAYCEHEAERTSARRA